MTGGPILQTDPHAGYLTHKAEIDAAVARVLSSGRYILGGEVEAFEAEFAAFLGSQAAVGVASGTDALTLGLKALGVGAGDAVITVSHTAVATVAAIEQAGAMPILADVSPFSFTMAPDHLAAALKRPPRPIKAIVPVHLYGHPAAMTEIMSMARAARAGSSVTTAPASPRAPRFLVG